MNGNERRFIIRGPTIRTHVQTFIGKVAMEPPTEVIVRPYVEKRTLEQNARLWKLHTLAGEHTGYSAEEMHEHALCRFYGYTERKVVDLFTGEILTKRVPNERSSGQNKKGFRVFMDSTEAWYVSEFGVFLDQREAA